ncbi:MAG: DUF5668 domain-containing protein [Chloroflexi bacterium]|nr:DUF5668 domain-containing protein [Chloroflexota bacterium]
MLLVGGVLLLLQTTGVVSWDVWANIWRYWPVILIAIGINVMVGRRLPLIAGLLILLLLGGAVTVASVRAIDGDGGETSSFTEQLNGLTSADVHVAFGGGDLRIHSLGAEADTFIRGQFEGLPADVVFERAGDTGRLRIESSGTGFFSDFGDTVWDIGMSRQAEFDLDVDAGAADLNLDLRDLQVTRLDVAVGAANAAIVVPSGAGHVDVVISAGAASINVVVPEGVAARISSDSGLSSVDVNTSRFPRSGDEYISVGYGSATDRVYIRIRVGAASVDIR